METTEPSVHGDYFQDIVEMLLTRCYVALRRRRSLQKSDQYVGRMYETQ